ncbi:hypothetical protein [Bradyrhizobium sp. 141]|uniref:hypothetical protein n=1 Tax=Bradyrhizobium sp. 141 TaxID=2782617 RepID=UPI001FF873B1|nr:hypothetical protein [Bradyrhizobium sp. 141]MCK1718874.1 hypothetical protein [Bradyrhizobium sp. 141]
MTVPAVATASIPDQPRKQARILKITRKVRDAISLMVWEGLKRDDAAQRVGMKDNSLYVALRKPDVRAFYLSECEVLRTSGRARRLHRLEQMSEQDDNKQAAVNAILALERLAPSDEAAVGRAASMPGLQIVIQTNGPNPPVIDVTPAQDLPDVD